MAPDWPETAWPDAATAPARLVSVFNVFNVFNAFNVFRALEVVDVVDEVRPFSAAVSWPKKSEVGASVPEDPDEYPDVEGATPAIGVAAGAAGTSGVAGAISGTVLFVLRLS